VLTLLLVGLLAGLVGVIVAPALARPLGYGQQLGNSYARFVAKALKRPAIGVGKHGDLKLTKLEFDETYEKETLSTGGVERKVTGRRRTSTGWGRHPSRSSTSTGASRSTCGTS